MDLQLQGNLWDFVVVFISGLLVSFSPCLYPVMPITASFIAGINTKGSRWQGFFISLIYVLGLAVTYAGLAAFAALSGKVFGQLHNQPWVFLVIANVLLFFSLVLLDVVPLPSLGAPLGARPRPRNLGAVFVFGAASGLAVGPCTAPILGTVLLYVASRQNLFYGMSLLFVFAYGVGASLILIGTFSGFLSRLPKSGPWLLGIKKFCGIVLLVVAEYYLVKAGSLM